MSTVITAGKSGTKGGCLAYDVWMVGSGGEEPLQNLQ